jgi:hypothetical protein
MTSAKTDSPAFLETDAKMIFVRHIFIKKKLNVHMYKIYVIMQSSIEGSLSIKNILVILGELCMYVLRVRMSLICTDGDVNALNEFDAITIFFERVVKLSFIIYVLT